MSGLTIQYAKLSEKKKKNSPLRIQRTKSSQPIKSPADRILFLQRTIGNQAVLRLIQSGTLQSKLRIGLPGDKYEQEADRVADAVMQMPEPRVQRQVEPEEEEMLQAKSTSGHLSEVTPNLESHILSLKGGGQPLSESERTYFEPCFGRDFSQVRVHTGIQAAESAKAVNARAFTLGNDVVFGIEQYAPGTNEGQRLMAHELTHVVQQTRDQKRDNLYQIHRDNLIYREAAPERAHRFSAEGVNVLVRTSCGRPNFSHATVETAVRDALDKIFNSNCIAEDRRRQIQRNLRRNGLDFICRRSASIGGKCARAEGFFIPANYIALGSASFPMHPDHNGCDPLASQVLHEIIHITRGTYPEALPDSCEASCYGVGGDPTLCQSPIIAP